MIIKFQYPFSPSVRWTEDAAQGLVGQEFKAKLKDEEIGIGKVLEAEVKEDGQMIMLTVEWPDDPVSQMLLNFMKTEFKIEEKNE